MTSRVLPTASPPSVMDTDLLSSISRFAQRWLLQQRLISLAVMDTNFASNVHFPLLLPLSKSLLGPFLFCPASIQLSAHRDRLWAKADSRQLHQGPLHWQEMGWEALWESLHWVP